MDSIGGAGAALDQDQVERFITARLAALQLDGRSLCVVIPDATRSCPLPILLGAIQRAVTGKVSACQVVVALGTHSPMTAAAIETMVGDVGLDVVNHEWWKPDTFAGVGVLDAEQVSRLSGGRIANRSSSGSTDWWSTAMSRSSWDLCCHTKWSGFRVETNTSSRACPARR